MPEPGSNRNVFPLIVLRVGLMPPNIPQPIVTYKLKSSRFYIALMEYLPKYLGWNTEQKWNFM